MIFSVIGTGAIGGYYGAKLAKAGEEDHFLFHKDYEHVLANGLEVRSKAGDFKLEKVNAYRRTQDMPKSDIVIVGLKTVNESMLAELLPPLLKEDTLVLLIQNGIGVEEDVQAMFPGLWLAAGLAFICSAKTEPGVVNHQDYGHITIGNYSCPDNTKVAALVDAFRNAGVVASEVEYHEARWRKAVWNMPFNGLTVARETSTDKLLSDPETYALVEGMMLEVIHAAQHLGVKGIDESFAAKMLDMTIKMTPYSPSMKLDWDFHRPMEIYYLYTKPIMTARKTGFEMPLLSALEEDLKRKESTRNTRR
jgi:2-dehydropantoate 2-reductase